MDSDQFSSSLSIAEQGILGHLLAFLIQSPAELDELTDVDNGVNPQHFEIDQADIKIRIRIPDHFWLRRPKFKESGAFGIGGGMLSPHTKTDTNKTKNLTSSNNR